MTDVDLERGDTLVGGMRFADAYPTSTPPYALNAEWFVRSAEILVNGHLRTPYASPRAIRPDLLERVGEFEGIPVYAETGTGPNHEILYLPVRPGCEFQQYVRVAPY